MRKISIICSINYIIWKNHYTYILYTYFIHMYTHVYTWIHRKILAVVILKLWDYGSYNFLSFKYLNFLIFL